MWSMQSPKQKILIITPHYSPAIRPRAFRWTTVAEKLVQRGHEVQVLCSKHITRKGGPEVMNGVRIYRAGYNSLKEIYYHLFAVGKRRGAVRPVWQEEVAAALDNAQEQTGGISRFLRTFEPVAKNNRVSWLNRFLLWFNNTFWRSIYWPDDASVWYFTALRKADALWKKAGPFDTVISVSLPFTSHWVTKKLREKYAFKWIVDIGDPFFLQQEYPVNNPFWYKKRNFRCEKEVLGASDSISVTNEVVKEAYIHTFGIGAGKIHVIPPVSGPVATPESDGLRTRVKNIKKDQPEKLIHIGYFGSFFTKIRTPKDFLDLVERWFTLMPEYRNRVQLHFFGDIFEEFLSLFDAYPGLKNNIHLYGLVPRETVPVFMESMDILLNIGNQSNLHLPSKSADYIRSGKPILHFSYFTSDTFFDSIRGQSRCFTVDFSEGRIAETKIREMAAFVEAPGEEIQAVLSSAPDELRNDAEEVVDRYEGLL